MASRISWDCYEVALLLSAYERVAEESDINMEAVRLSATLRNLAIRRGILIDETYRNVNGIKMQLANVQYLFTDGKKGLSGASAMIRQMYKLYKTNPTEYQMILDEANQMTETLPMSVEDAFFAYAKEKTDLSPKMLADYLQKAADYCHLKQPLLGMTDAKTVHNIQQKVAGGKLLRFRFGKKAQTIRNVTQLYYTFIKSYHELKKDVITQLTYPARDTDVEQAAREKPPIISAEEFGNLNESVEKDENISKKAPSKEWIIAQLKAQGITYQDKRNRGGCLWIVGDQRLCTFVQECRAKGYTLSYKADGCKAYPNRPVWWTKDYVEEKIDLSDFRHRLDERFKTFLLSAKKLSTSTATQYSRSIQAVERFILERGLDCTLDTEDPDEAQRIYGVLMGQKNFVDWNNQYHHQYSAALAQYVDYLRQDEADTKDTDILNAITITEDQEAASADDRWLPILQDSFPNGYILNDFLGQFQAAAFWQERYGEVCSIQGNAIDAAMKLVGVVRDGRVFAKSDKDEQLISTICAEINDILSCYTTVYRSCIYNRYQEQLAACSIYTEQVMAQQLLSEAKGTFCLVNQVFTKCGQNASAIQDVRQVLRDHGGAMSVSDVAKVLWFIPYNMVYHYLSVDDESLNVGNSTWMLAEHFPLTREDAGKIGDMLDEYFLTSNSNYVQASNLMPLLEDRLPVVADDLNGMNYMAIFNIVTYYLRDRFSFTKAIISPKGSSIDFAVLFKSFAAEHETFTLADLETFASELKLPIYWESTYAGGAVRVSKTDFVNKRLMNFDVDAIDEILQDFCPDDYLPLMAVSSAMMMHLPSCGYQWNGYLLQSYVFGFSKAFGLFYSSFGKTGYYGAMVRRSCKAISNYGSLIERVLTDDGTWETTADALDVLVKHGYQALRKYKGIDTAVAKAKQNKLSSDDRR